MSALVPFESHPKAKVIARHVKAILEELGLDPNSEAFKRTPIRVASVLLRMTEGYNREVTLTRTYTERSDLVASFGIPFVSICEHHLAVFYGTVDIGYIPRNQVTGMSKLDQLVEKYALRPQIQERFTSQIADELWKTLQPNGVIVVTEAIHTCKLLEGFQPSTYTCSACRGVFLWNTAPRDEFLKLRLAHRR
ncbi:MAG: GTP cyclohydrolase I FolE [Thermoprotei archaeon]|nr:MAG: GTP cyclohydrolase I FolE [Thermoprotei archaeon]